MQLGMSAFGKKRTSTYSRTASARRRKASGILSPSAFAVVRLMTSSNAVGCSTGRSAGSAPLRILSTISLARRNKSVLFAPYDIRPPASTYPRTELIVGSRAPRTGEIDVVGDRTGFDRLDQVERRPCVEDLRLADVLQREPHLLTVRRCSDVRAERTFLLHPRHNLMVGDRHNNGLRIEGRANVAVFAVGRKNLHPGAGRCDDTGLFHEGLCIKHGDIIFATHRNPDFLTVRREERFVRRTTDIRYVFYGVGRSIDKGYRV